MTKEKIQVIALTLLGIVCLGIIIFFFADRIIPVFAPFLIAWCVAFAVRDPASKLSSKIRIPERILRVFIAVFVTLLSFGAIALLIWQFSALLWRLLTGIGEGDRLYGFFDALGSKSLPFFGNIFPEELSERLTEAFGSLVESLLKSLGEAVTSWVTLIPGALFFLLVTLISLVYFCLDLERINATVKAILPKKTGEALSSLRRAAFSVTAKYIRSYLFILLITFAVMLIGFIIIGIESAPLLALVVALLDILPVIGVGTVLLPWSIFELATGSLGKGVGLIILFLVNTMVRQFSEPRIVGKSLDLHPVLTLVLIYSGCALFGFVGILLVPILSVIIGLLFKNKGASEIGKSSVGERDHL